MTTLVALVMGPIAAMDIRGCEKYGGQGGEVGRTGRLVTLPVLGAAF